MKSWYNTIMTVKHFIYAKEIDTPFSEEFITRYNLEEVVENLLHNGWKIISIIKTTNRRYIQDDDDSTGFYITDDTYEIIAYHA